MRKQLDFNDMWDNIRTELELAKESPRAQVILFAANMISILEEIICLNFNSEIFNKQREDMKVKIALEFDLISEYLAHNIRSINEIRNKFAHSPNVHSKQFFKKFEKDIINIPKYQKKSLKKLGALDEFNRVAFEVIESLHYFYDAAWIKYKNQHDSRKSD